MYADSSYYPVHIFCHGMNLKGLFSFEILSNVQIAIADHSL